MKTYSIILAGGTGIRMAMPVPKCNLKLTERSILEETISIFENSDLIDDIIVVVPEFENTDKKYKKNLKYVPGGATRGQSITNAITAISDEDANVVIHDGARPLLSPDVIQKGLKELVTHDIVKTVGKSHNDIISFEKVITREQYHILSSPDFTTLSYARKLLPFLKKDNCITMAAFHAFSKPKISYVESNKENIKITFPEDLTLAKLYFQK